MATPTYEAIASITLDSSASSVTFSSIPQDYRDLVLVANFKNSTQAGNRITINNDTSSIYDSVHMRGFSEDKSSGSISGDNKFSNEVGDAGSHLVIMQCFDYIDTSKFKTVFIATDHAETRAATEREAGLYKSTDAITSIKIERSNGSMNTGGTFALYGIAS